MPGTRSCVTTGIDNPRTLLPARRGREKSPTHTRGNTLIARSGFHRRGLELSFAHAQSSRRAHAMRQILANREIAVLAHEALPPRPADEYWARSRLTGCARGAFHDDRVPRENAVGRSKAFSNPEDAISISTTALETQPQAH